MVCLRLNRDLFEMGPTFKDFSSSVRYDLSVSKYLLEAYAVQTKT